MTTAEIINRLLDRYIKEICNNLDNRWKLFKRQKLRGFTINREIERLIDDEMVILCSPNYNFVSFEIK